jgi:PEP-CTERM motif
MNATINTSGLARALCLLLVAAGIVATFAPASQAVIITGNLLVDPGFENPALTPFTQILGPPFTTGVWGGENAANVTGPDNGVSPAGGVQMHRMDDDGLSATQSWQLVDVTPYSAAINAGNATVNFSALFNVPQDVQAAAGSVGVSFFNAGQVPLPPLFTGVPSNPDSNPAGWQSYGLGGLAVPPTTSYIRMQVAYSNVTMQSPVGPNRPGFVDDARLTLTLVPEPATLALGAMALLGMVCIGRRR